MDDHVTRGLTGSSLSDAVFVGRKEKERESKVKVR